MAGASDADRDAYASRIQPMLTNMVTSSLRELPEDVEGFMIGHLEKVRADRKPAARRRTRVQAPAEEEQSETRGQAPVEEEQGEIVQAARVRARTATLAMKKTKTIKKNMRLRNILLRAAEQKHDMAKRMAFLVLCGDDMLCEDAVCNNVMVENEDTVRFWAVCPGVTTQELQKPRLSSAAVSSIIRTVRQVQEEAKGMDMEIAGITGDRPFWLKHQNALRMMLGVDAIDIYMSTLIQLPMIAASFKNAEKCLIVTFGSASEFSMWQQEVLESSGVTVENMDRLVVMGASELSPEWMRFTVGSTTPEQDKELGALLLEAVRRRIEEENHPDKRDMFVKAILLSPKISAFAQLLREETAMPVFDELTLLKFFNSGRSLSHYSEASRLKQLVQTKVMKKQDVADMPAVGLLRLDYSYPPALGDLDHEGTFGFRVVPRTVDKLFFERAQDGSFEQPIMENMTKAIKELEDDENVIGITANCGFMMFYQCFARHVARVPVFMSSLVQAQSIVSSLLPHERVLILTANSESLAPGKDTMLRNSGINVTDSDVYLIEGLQDLDGFEAVAEGARVDTIKVQHTLTKRILDVIERERSHMPIRCILCECTELPHFSDSLRKATGLMVFDSVTVVNFFFGATASKDWNTKTFSAHNKKFWDERFDHDGHSLK